MRVRVGVKLGSGVEETTEGMLDAGGVNGCQVGDGVDVRVGAGVGVNVAALFPSACESKMAPRSRPIETMAMMIPRNTCRKFCIANSLQAPLPGPAAGR